MNSSVRRWGRSAAAPTAAAVASILIHLAVARALGFTPFGPVGRAVGDYAPQYLPFHVLFRDILLGRAEGGLTFTWSLGTGTGFLPIYSTYLSGPFTPLVALFPLKWMDVAILTISLLRIGLAAAAMVVLLQMLRPRGPRLAATLMAVGYACSSWVVQLGMITPQWLDGLLALPLMCIAAMLTVRRRALLVPIGLVALAWWSNYYSAIMASLGAGLFLVTWLVATRGQLVRGVLSFAVRGVLGVLLVSWMLVPSIRAVATAAPAPAASVEVDRATVVQRLFGFTADITQAPMLFAGSLVLLAVLALPLAAHLSWRRRLVWFALPVALVVFMNNSLLLWIFNGGDEPNGNPYRWSFVVVGLMVVAGWHAFAPQAPGARSRPWFNPLQLVAAGLALFGVVRYAMRTEDVRQHVTYSTWWLGPVILLGLLLLGSVLARRVRSLEQLLVAILVVGELIWSATIIIPHARFGYGVSEPYAVTATQERTSSQRALAVAQWPQRRAAMPVDAPLPKWSNANAPARWGLPGTTLYSSTIPAEYRASLARLGVFPGHARSVNEPRGQLAESVFAIQARYNFAENRAVTQPAFPMARVITGERPPPEADFAALWQGLFNTRVVNPGQGSFTWTNGDPVDETRGRLNSKLRLTVRCDVGKPLLRLPGIRRGAAVVEHGSISEKVPTLGQFHPVDVPAGTQVRATFSGGNNPYSVPMGYALCLDEPALLDEIASTPTPQISVDGSRITTRFATPQTGDVTFAIINQAGWTCRADSRSVTPLSRSGFLAVPVQGATEVSCVHRTPGLGLGIGLSVAALVVTLLLAVARRRWGAAKPGARDQIAGRDGPVAAAPGRTSWQRIVDLVRHPTVGQVVRFGVVGVANTAVYYGFYRLLLASGLVYVVAHLVAWAISVVFSFYANCLFTYRVKPTWRRFLAFPLTTLVNVAFTTIGSVVLVSGIGVDERYATLVMGIAAIPFTFLVTRFVLVGRASPQANPDPGSQQR